MKDQPVSEAKELMWVLIGTGICFGLVVSSIGFAFYLVK